MYLPVLATDQGVISPSSPRKNPCCATPCRVLQYHCIHVLVYVQRNASAPLYSPVPVPPVAAMRTGRGDAVRIAANATASLCPDLPTLYQVLYICRVRPKVAPCISATCDMSLFCTFRAVQLLLIMRRAKRAAVSLFFLVFQEKKSFSYRIAYEGRVPRTTFSVCVCLCVCF